MSTRSAAAAPRHPSQRPPALPQPPNMVSTSTPRSGTPTRNAPRNRGQHMPSAGTPANVSPPSTPTGRKRNTGRKRADARKQPQAAQASDEDTPEEDLMELLGMTSSTQSLPQEKGILSISKGDIDAASQKPARSRKPPRQKAAEVADWSHAETPASSDPEGPRRSRRGKKTDQEAPVNQNSPRRKSKPPRVAASRDDSPGPSFDVSNLSQSLPHSFFGDSDKNANNGQAWDMPAEATGGQPLNWQQQLVAEDSSSRRSQRLASKGTGGRKNKNLDKAGGHDRHSSYDMTPTSNLTAMMKANNQTTNFSSDPTSAPFHTGFNAHRAPQTPIRHSGNHSSPDPSTSISLPIVGEFPRLNKSGMPLGGIKYAGPTFHNSPASGSLPAPDLDDF